MQDETEFQEHKQAKYFIIPHRYITVILLYVAILLSACMNNVLTRTLSLVVHVPKEEDEPDPHCIRNNSKINETKSNLTNYHITEWKQNDLDITSKSLEIGFAVGEIVGGIAGDIYGGKYVFVITLFTKSFIFFFYPIIITSSKANFILAIITCFVTKFLYGIIHATMCSILGQWLIPGEKTTMISISYSGPTTGRFIARTVFDNFYDQGHGRWQNSYYINASLGVPLSIICHYLLFSNPMRNPYLKIKERRHYLNREIVHWFAEGGNLGAKTKRIPWLGIMKSAGFWALFFSYIGMSGSWFVVFDYFRDEFMKKILNIKFTWVSLISVFVFLGITIPIGVLCDVIVNKKILSCTTVRKMFITIGCMGVCIFMVGGSLAGCEEVPIKLIWLLTDCCICIYYINVIVNVLDISLNFPGTLIGIFIFTSRIINKFILPVLSDYILKKRTIYYWRIFFFCWLLCGSVTNFIYTLFGSAERYDWDYWVSRSTD